MHSSLIIIVIYNKKIKDLVIFKEVLQEETDIFIYDNSPVPQALPKISNANISYEHDTHNSGVSRAYNRGVLKAKELSKDTVLLLDQDTIFVKEYLEQYQEQYALYRNEYIYAPVVSDSQKTKIYSPGMLTHLVGKAIPFDDFKFETVYDLSSKSVINSGLLIPLAIFDRIGGFNEEIKLDFSDIYFIEKYKAFSSKIILVDLYLQHSLSGDEGKNFDAEMHRFKYYCNGAKELSRDLSMSSIYSVSRRMLRLIQKYQTIKPIKIFFDYYVGGKPI